MHDSGRRRADVIMTNGKFLTVDEKNRIVDAVAIGDGSFLAVGSREEILTWADEHTRIMDVNGRTVIPGVFDSHNHVLPAGKLLDGVMLFGAESLDELKERLAEKVRVTPRGQWIQGGGWIESQFAENRMPSRWDLDEVAPDHPVILDRLFARSVVNSKALQLAGIDRRTPNPARGIIDRDLKTGEPTGILRNGAWSLVEAVMPQKPHEEILADTEYFLNLAMQEYLRWGITSIIDPGIDVPTMRAYRKMHKERSLLLRINMMPECYGMQDYGTDEVDGILKYIGIDSGFGDLWLGLGALKMAIDGGVGSKTAMMYDPWIDGTHSRGNPRFNAEVLNDLVLRAHRMGWSVGIHTCGDEAQDIAVDAFVKAQEQYPRNDVRHNIVHGYLPTPDALKKMRDYGIGVSLQPGFMFIEGDIYFDVLDQPRIEHFKPLRTYLDTGIHVAANSDMTSAHYNPFVGMYAAVARKTSQGKSLGDGEKISREEMLRLFTRNGAWLAFRESKVGSMEPGKVADLAVLSDDIYTCPEDAIMDIQVVMTMVDGKVVHEKLD